MERTKEIFCIQNRIRERIERIENNLYSLNKGKKEPLFEQICECFEVLCEVTARCQENEKNLQNG